MPRFYFNLFNDATTIDEEGVELPDLAAAMAQARTGAAQLIAETITAGRRIDLDHRIEVEDEERRTLFVLPFRELVREDEGAADA